PCMAADIVHGIRQHLAEAEWIAPQILRDAPRDVGEELEPLLVRFLRGERGDRTDDFVELAGFDLRKAEQASQKDPQDVDDQNLPSGLVDCLYRLLPGKVRLIFVILYPFARNLASSLTNVRDLTA